MTALEAFHTIKVEVYPEEGNTWKAALVRLNNDNIIPIGNFTGLTAAEVYHKFGIKTPEAEVSKTERRAKAESILRDRLASLGSTTIITRTDHENSLLDILSALGYDNDEEE